MTHQDDHHIDLPEMPCREFVEQVTAYLEGALSETDRLRLEEHLLACRHCALYLDQLRETQALVGHVEPDALSAAARSELMGAFASWAAGRA